MKNSIKNTIYQAIYQSKWLDISYVNKDKEHTRYYIGIKDIDCIKKRIYCEIFNVYKNGQCLDVKNPFINYEQIEDAFVVDNSYFPVSNKLLERIEKDRELQTFLETETMDNNILCYLSDCYRMDTDPYLKSSVVIDGIDEDVFRNNGTIKLTDQQFAKLLDDVFKNDRYESERIYRYQELAINCFSIDINNKQYVVAYKRLSLNFKDRTLKMAEKATINKSFLIDEEKKVTLGSYLDMSPDDFCASYDANEREMKELVAQNFRYGEKLNTKANIFLLGRNTQKGVDRAFESISIMESEGALTFPLKSFFGRNRQGTGTSKTPNIVVFNKSKINIDQLRVVYNSMVNHVTFVKGPPGTGKTETIFNVLLSAYSNDKKVLVCSNNNHPVNDIFEKMTRSLSHKVPHSQRVENILFPIMRLGNNSEMRETINRLRMIIAFAKDKQHSNINEDSTEKSKSKSLSAFSELRTLLENYEKKQEATEILYKLEAFREIGIETPLSKQIEIEIENVKERISSLAISEDEITKYTISAADDINFQNYAYYSSLAKLRKILSPNYKELREIAAIDVIDDAVIELNKYLSDDKNLKRFTDIFPIIICTNLSCDKLGSPHPLFDLCIMDEAGQCNIASSLIPIVRAENLLLVGDTNQLQPVTVIETAINDKYLEKYNIKLEYDYVKNSILSTMLRKDANSKNILLRYHYRCGKKIAGFVNERFYDEQLKLINQLPGNLFYYNVKNTFNPNTRNSYEQEANEIVKIIKENNYKDIGIVTPFVNQANLINDLLIKNGISGVSAGTVHTLQGSEKTTIIMSAALSLRTAKKTMDWIKNNHELINVAVTRAKENLIFVGDKEAIDLLSKNEINDIKALSDYVSSNGEMIVPKCETIISYDFSNNSQNEKEFFETIRPYFKARSKKFRIERNIKVKTAIKNIAITDLSLIGDKEFDLAIMIQTGVLSRSYKTIVVFEIDGGEHFGSKTTAKRDRTKEEICKKYEIKLIRIANSQTKDYELIIRLFESWAGKIADVQEQPEQISLLDIN